jgi:hypothetical protein
MKCFEGGKRGLTPIHTEAVHEVLGVMAMEKLRPDRTDSKL